jgi:multidrug efflux pump subunit AcrA (membrane-fusion protein)
MRRLINAVICVALTVAGARGLADAPELLDPAGVRADTAAVEASEFFNIKIFDGSVVPYVEECYFTIDGQVDMVYARLGEAVQLGQPLITLDDRQLKRRIDELRETIEFIEKELEYQNAIAEIDIRLMELELDHIRNEARGEAGGAQMSIELLEADISQARADINQHNQIIQQIELDSGRRELKALQAKLERNIIYAPFTGRVAFGQNVKKGYWIKAYDPLVFMADDARLTVKSAYVSGFYIKGADRMYALIGDEEYEIAEIPMEESEYIAQTLAGYAVMTEFKILTGTRESFNKITPGMYAAVCVINNYIESALVIPSNSLFREGSVRYVYIMGKDGSRERREVKAGLSNDSVTHIIEGLEEGEIVYVKD